MFDFSPKIATAIGAVAAFLVVCHSTIFALAKIKKNVDFSNLKSRMLSWYFIFLFLVFIFLGNGLIAQFFVAIVCFLALREYFAFFQFEPDDRRLQRLAYLAIPIQAYFLYTNWLVMFYLFVPLYMFLIVPLGRIFAGKTANFTRTVSIVQWGMLLGVYSLGYLGAFLSLPDSPNVANKMELGKEALLFVLFVNSLNDAAQYVWGKTLGKRKIVPSISPNKTWVGFLGGVATTSVISVLLAPLLTPLSLGQAAVAGVLISVFGFFGDVVMSAVKRDAGVKDSSHLIPGHGGVLDRADSLTYAVPLFFHFFVYFCYNNL